MHRALNHPETVSLSLPTPHARCPPPPPSNSLACSTYFSPVHLCSSSSVSPNPHPPLTSLVSPLIFIFSTLILLFLNLLFPLTSLPLILPFAILLHIYLPLFFPHFSFVHPPFIPPSFPPPLVLSPRLLPLLPSPSSPRQSAKTAPFPLIASPQLFRNMTHEK